MIHGLWREVILVVAAAPLAYYVVAMIAAVRFFHRASARGDTTFAPPVSVLKPVRGLDFGSYENFTSFCRQDYPDYEILFAVKDANDPAAGLIRRIAAEFPERRIRLIIGAEELGANRKVNKLCRLAREAKHEILVLTDGDVRVGPNFLREVVAPFADARTGAVTCLYSSIAEKNLGAELEAIGASSDFIAGVLVAGWMEGMSFGLGASIATSKKWIARIGGFESLVDLLSDDYELGHRIAEAGGCVLLSREMVWTMYPARTLRGFLDHQVRWARTVRICRPLSYLGLILTHGLPWALLAAVIAPVKWLGLAYPATYLILRMAMAWTVGVWGLKDEVLRRKMWLLPFRDAVNFGIWLTAFFSNHISWAGENFEIHDGRMVPVGAPGDAASSATIASRRAGG